MKRLVGSIVLLALVGGCAQSRQSPATLLRAANDEPQLLAGDLAVTPLLAAEIPGDRVVAMVQGQPITLAELQQPLLEAYGLKILLFQLQLKLATQEAARVKIEVTQADVDAELNRTLKAAFKDSDVTAEDYPALLQQLLDNQGISRPEFDMVVRTNATLRKIAEPELKGRITEDNVKEAFNVMFGESVVVRHIQVSNPQEALQVQRRIGAGEKFEDLAKAMSRNPRTGPLGGELPPFNRNTVNWSSGMGKVPEAFKGWAFSAKVGDISDPIQGETAYHILKLERKMAPKTIKYDDVKAEVRAKLEENLSEAAVATLRQKLSKLAQSALVIQEPTLRKQYELKLAQQEKAIRERQKIQDELRNRATTRPATQGGPTTNPFGTLSPEGVKASPANVPTGERPPATKSTGPAPVDSKK